MYPAVRYGAGPEPAQDRSRHAGRNGELDRALTGARASGDAFSVYFASVSLADLDERAGRAGGAKAHRADAAAAKPFGAPLFAGLAPLAVYRAAEFSRQPRRTAAWRALVRR